MCSQPPQSVIILIVNAGVGGWGGTLDSLSSAVMYLITSDLYLMVDLLNILFESELSESLGIHGRQRLEAIFKVTDPRPREVLQVAHCHTADE